MKVYLAAPYATRDLMLAVSSMMRDQGHVITSQWILATHDISQDVLDAAPGHSDDHLRTQVAGDFADIDAAEAVVLFTGNWVVAKYGFTLPQTTSGGRHIETGYALAKGKLVIILGEPENIFHRGACLLAESLDDVLCLLFNDNEEADTD